MNVKYMQMNSSDGKKEGYGSRVVGRKLEKFSVKVRDGRA